MTRQTSGPILEPLDPQFPDCVVKLPHIIGDPCQPRWVVQCECGHWFWYSAKHWTDKRNEFDAFFALYGFADKVWKNHPKGGNNEQGDGRKPSSL